MAYIRAGWLAVCAAFLGVLSQSAGAAAQKMLWVTVIDASGQLLPDAELSAFDAAGLPVETIGLPDGTHLLLGLDDTTTIKIRRGHTAASVQLDLPQAPFVIAEVQLLRGTARAVVDPDGSTAGGLAVLTLGCPGSGDCCVATGTPGCNDAACCNLVCAVDPFCCDVSWDSICAGEALTLCGDLCQTTGCPGDGDCCVADGTPGCDNAECCSIVCAVDPFCCDVSWDSICAGEALSLCGDLCFNDECEEALPVDLPPGGSVNVDGSTTGASFDLTPVCVLVHQSPGVWYSVIGNGNTIFASTCNQADFDTMISVYCGDCQEGEVSNCCFATGVPGCDDPTCEAAVCAFDPFCCDTAWDSICASEAATTCGICQSSGGLICVTGADDTTGCGLTTGVSWCAREGAEYLVLIHGFDTAAGDFTLSLLDDGIPCIPTTECPLPEGACCLCEGPAQVCEILSEADCATAGGEYLGDGTNCGALTATSNPDLPIPDAAPAGVSDTINVADSFTIGDLDVRLEITHTWVGDLCVTLEKDGGAPILLIARMGADTGVPCHQNDPFGCAADNLADVTLDDGASTSIEDQCTANLAGTFRPHLDSLAAFNGLDSAGAWTLEVSDNAVGDVGTLVSWSLLLQAEQSVCEDALPGQCALEATLDIKPGSCPNPYNRNAQGYLPVALAGTADIPAGQVDPATLRLARANGVGGSVAPHEGPPGPHTVIADVATPFGGDLCGCHSLEGDGTPDVSMKFSRPLLTEVLELEDLPNGAVVELVLTGTLLDGTPFAAGDCITVVPPATLMLRSNLAGIPVDLSPANDDGVDGGSAPFDVVYPQTSVVVVTVPVTPPQKPGWVLDRWWFDGADHFGLGPAIELEIDHASELVMAIYRRQSSGMSFSPGQEGPTQD